MKKFFKILKVSAWTLVIIGAIALIGYSETSHFNRRCNAVRITIDYGSADILVTKGDIDSIVRKTAGILHGKPLGIIHSGAIEKAVRSQPYVSKVSVYEGIKGELFIDIKQREPILRVLNNKYESFYIDDAGALLPINPKYSANVLVANGCITDSYRKNPGYSVDIMALSDSIYTDSVITGLYRLAKYISHHKFLKSQIGQIYVNDYQEFELIPRIGDHVILLGKAQGLDQKFRKLYAFYRLGLNKTGWEKYNVINIKYKDQVVCSKI